MADQTETPAWAQGEPAAPQAAPAWATQDAQTAPPSTGPSVPLAGGNTEAYQAVDQKLFQRTQPGAFMSVVSQAFGTDQPMGISDQTAQHLRDTGVFNDYAKGQDDFVKNFNEAIMRPAALIGDTVMRGLNAAVVLPVGLAGAAVDKVEGALGMEHESPETNAYHAQDFADYIFISAGFSADGMPIRRGGGGQPPEPPTPPSAQRMPVVEPKPWQAQITFKPVTEEEMAKQTTSQPPPVTNLPVIGSPEAMAADKSVPVSPTDPIPHENPIVDGSGNLNLNFVRADQDTKDAMAKVAEAYSQKFGTSIPHAETEESAREFMDEATGQVTNGIPDVLGNFARGDAVSRDLLWTARQMSVQASTDFGRLSKVAAATGDEADIAAAKDAFTRMVQLVGPIRHEITGEAGRILESMKIPVGEEAATDGAPTITEDAAQKLIGMNVHDAIRIAGTLDTPQDVAKFAQDLQKPSFAEMGLYYVFNNYLSGPITHLAYTASWGVQTVIRAGLETPMASAIGKIQELAGKTVSPEELNALQRERATIADRLASADSTQGERLSAIDRAPLEARLQEIMDRLKNGVTVMPAESAARFYGIGEGALDSIRSFGRALRTGNVQMLPGEMKSAEEAQKTAEAAALKKGLKPEDAVKAGQAAYNDKAMNFGNPIVEYGKMMKNPAGSATVQALGQVIGIPMRVIAALHSLQKFSGYAESMNALAYRQAASEGLEGTLTGANALGQRIAEIKNNPTPEMMKQAADEAKYAALMGQSGRVGKLFQNLANANAWTRMVVPFSKVVTNLTAQKVLERTPVGLLSPVIRGRIMGEEGAAAQATQIAKMLTGSTLLMGGAYLAAQGVNHGWGSDDPKERSFDYLSGRPPYSVRIGDLVLPHRFFGVAGGSLSLGADLHDISQTLMEDDTHWNDWMTAMGVSVHYIGRDLLSENALTGPAELYNAINDKENAAKHYVPNAIASAMLPFSSFQSQMNTRFIDPIMRQSMDDDSFQSISKTIESRTLFMSKNLLPKVDIFGNPMSRSSDPSWADKDPVMQALQHLDIYPAPVQPKWGKVDLDDKQFADYATIAGKTFYNNLLPTVSNPNWVRLPPQAQANIIQTAIKASRAQARGTMSLLYPQLPKDNAQAYQDLLHQYDQDGDQQ